MKTPQEIYELLKTRFPQELLNQNTAAFNEDAIEIKPEAAKVICEFLASDSELDFDNLILITALDDMNGKKNTAADGSFEFEGGTLTLVYHLESTSKRHRLVLKAALPRENPEIESVSHIWQHADWEEREAYDMMGIKFKNHPNLIRILMPYDWEAGYPLRKDYKNPEFYQGMKVPN